MKELPLIACSLYAGEQSARLDEWRALASRALEVTPSSAGAAVRFAAADEPEARRLAALETRCCPFFSFEFAPAGDGIVMSVRAPVDARELVERLFA